MYKFSTIGISTAHIQLKSFISKICLPLYGLSLLLAFLLNQPIVHADGGAPNLAYVAGGGTGISVIDVAQQKIIRTLPLDAPPAMLQLSADGSTLFLVQPTQNRALVMDAATGKVRCQAHAPGQPSLLVLSTQEDAFFVAGKNDNNVRVFAPDTCKLLRTIQISGPINGLAIALDGGVFPTHTGLYQLCVATTNRIIIFDPDGTQLTSYLIPAGPEYLTAPILDFTLYVTTRQGSVVVIDLKTNQITAPLLQQGSFGPMDYDETTKEVYVPDLQNRQVEVIAYKQGQQGAQKSPLRIFSMEGIPVTVAITNDGQLGFVALQDGRVVMLDLPGRQSMHTFNVGGNPRFIITGVYPPPLPPSLSSNQPTQNNAIAGQTALLALFGGIFFLALIGLIVVLRLFWKQHQSQ